jgi:serine/threonine protein kinase
LDLIFPNQIFEEMSDETFFSKNKKFLAYPQLKFGSDGVCVAKNVETEEDCVVKIIKEKKYVFGELSLWRRDLHHPSIIKFIEVDTIFDTTFIYMPRYESNLMKYLSTKSMANKGLPDEEIRTIFRRLCAPVEFLHSHKIAHRDLKFENYLVQSTEDGDFRIILSDFGLSFDWSISKEKVDYFRIGSPAYMAPELLVLSVYQVWKPDIWALGICLYFLTFGKFPFWSQHLAIVYERIKKIEYSFPFSSETSNVLEYKSLIGKVLCYSESRMTIQELMKGF